MSSLVGRREAPAFLPPPSTARTASPTRPKGPLELALETIEGRKRLLIVWGLFWGPRPFSELMRHVPDITKKTLRRELAELERLGLVRRELRPGSSRRAEYALSPLGETLRPLVGALYEWGLLRLRLVRDVQPAVPGAVPLRASARWPVSPDKSRPLGERPLSGEEDMS